MASFIPFVVVLFFVTSSHAAEAWREIDLRTENCLDANLSTVGMRDCFTQEEKEWDGELNRLYNQLQGHLEPAGKDALKDAQHVWITQRDKEFALINAIHGQMEGTMWTPVMASKRADVVKDRALALQSYLDLLTEEEP